MEQRFVELEILDITPSAVTVAMPPSTCYATPGPYMLFGISPIVSDTEGGVPSLGQYLQVQGTCAAAEAAADPPTAGFVPRAVNTRSADELVARCQSSPTPLELVDLGRSVAELCVALGGCPENATVQLQARLVASSTQSVPPSGTVLDTGVLQFVRGSASFIDPLRIDAKSGAWTSAVDLGSGAHQLQLCASMTGISGCIEQPLRIDALTGSGSNTHGYRLGTIESRFQPLVELPNTTDIVLGDDGIATVPFPGKFTFPYFGTNYTSMRVGANGGIRFTAGSVAPSNGTLPTAATTAPHIAVFWDDLNPAAGGRVLMHRDGPKVVVSWEGVPHKQGSTSNPVSFQVALWQDGRIEMHYADALVGATALDNGRSATMGIQRPNGTDALRLSINSPSWLASGARAAAYDLRGCIAADLRLPDSVPCEVALDTRAPIVATGCSSPSRVAVAVPPTPNVCNVERDTRLFGEVLTRAGARPIVDGEVTLAVGSYTTRWWVHENRPGASEGMITAPIAGPFEQALVVQAGCSFSSMSAVECIEAGAELVVLSDAADELSPLPFAVCADGLAGADELVGGQASDMLFGGEGADLIEGGEGDDLLVGGPDDDVLTGGAGADTIVAESGSDALHGGDGNDTLWGGPGLDELFGDGDDDVLVLGSGGGSAFGGAGNDVLVLVDACELDTGLLLDGGEGEDTLALPAGLGVVELEVLGVSLAAIETFVVADPLVYGASDCAPEAVP